MKLTVALRRPQLIGSVDNISINSIIKKPAFLTAYHPGKSVFLWIEISI